MRLRDRQCRFPRTLRSRTYVADDLASDSRHAKAASVPGAGCSPAGVAVSVRVVVDAETWSVPVALSPNETRGLRVPSDVEIRTLFLPMEIVDSFGRRWERLGSGELQETGGVAVNSRPAARLTWEER